MNIIISHIDLDGFGVNILNSLFKDFIDFDDIKNRNYGFENEPEIQALIVPENDLTIVDLSIPESVYVNWKSVLHSIRIIDHHETSKYIQNYENNVWSDQMSGTKLYWEFYLKPRLKITNNLSKIEYFVNLVDCYDRWQEDSDLWLNATRLNKVNQSLGDKFVAHMVDKLSMDWEWTSEEESCFKEVEAREDEILSDIEKDLSIKVDNKGFTFALVEIPEKSKLSMVCSKLLHKYPEIDYVIGYNARLHSFSFRSKRDYIDLTKIQGVFGHKHAAGAAYEMTDFYKLLLEDYCVTWCSENTRKSTVLIIEKIDS